MLENSWRILKRAESRIADIADHFLVLEANGEESRDGVENEGGHDMEMEKIGVEMADIAMDKTLQ